MVSINKRMVSYFVHVATAHDVSRGVWYIGLYICPPSHLAAKKGCSVPSLLGGGRPR